MDRWCGRVAIVTGASAGIGAAIALALARSGMKVVAVARRLDRLQNISNELQANKSKGELHPIQGDITSDEDIKRVVRWTREILGGADVLVNNAGVNRYGILTEQSTENIKMILDTNLVGLLSFTREVVQDMKSRGVDDGHIFNINSLAGHYIPEYSVGYIYVASKHAVTVVTEGFRREFRDMGTKIRITSISPGLVRTEMSVASGLSEDAANQKYSENPCMDPEDIADAVIYALGTKPHVQVHEITIRATAEVEIGAMQNHH
ncbi:farnesol dehydrogenase-like [Neocloeon triangulifer]|uniref:farnesol dehydrogenase-like n=1 Tax=Neocloeon triangulifer TaxID=2078957 RepID=UPI00286F3914|nr:farnesol dehydrogenase-like [Neocloeon triangulifer]